MLILVWLLVQMICPMSSDHYAFTVVWHSFTGNEYLTARLSQVYQKIGKIYQEPMQVQNSVVSEVNGEYDYTDLFQNKGLPSHYKDDMVEIVSYLYKRNFDSSKTKFDYKGQWRIWLQGPCSKYKSSPHYKIRWMRDLLIFIKELIQKYKQKNKIWL